MRFFIIYEKFIPDNEIAKRQVTKLPYVDINSQFDIVAAKARQSELDSQIPKGLGINRSALSWPLAWDNLIGQSPSKFYKTLSRDMPGEVDVFVDLAGTVGGEISVYINRNGRCVFEAENKITTDITGKTLRFEEWLIKEIDSRRHGMGLNLLRNMIDMAQAAGVDRIALRAGKEDGKFFWARHGFYLKEELHRNKLVANIEENLVRYSDTLPAGIYETVRSMLAENALDLSWRIARLPGTLNGKPLGWQLLEGDNNPEYIMNLKDEQQMARVRASLERPAVATLVPLAVPQPV